MKHFFTKAIKNSILALLVIGGIIFSNNVVSQTTIHALTKDTICSNDTVKLFATSSRASGVTYSWADTTSGGNSVSPGTGDTVMVFPTLTTHYRAIGDSAGVKDTTYFTVVVNMLPMVNISASDSEVCRNDTVMLVGSGAKSYSWKTSQVGLDQTGDTVWYQVSADRSYYLAGTDSNGCIGRDTQRVKMKWLPREKWNAWAGDFYTDNLACSDETTTLKTTHGRNTYKWLPTGVTTPGTGAVVTVNINSNTSITCVVDSSNGCSSSVVKTLFAFPKTHKISVAFKNNGTICENSSEKITATGASKYKWSPTTGLNRTDTGQVVATLTASQTYTVTGYSSACLADTTVTVNVIAKPDITLAREDGARVLCRDDSSVVVITSTKGVRFDWGYGVTSTSKRKAVTPGKTTLLKIIAYSKEGCTNSASVLIEVDQSCGTPLNVQEIFNSNGVKVYQKNPEFLVLEASNLANQTLNVELIDITGKVISTSSLQVNTNLQENRLSISGANKGIYFVRISSNDAQFTRKILIH